jgi:serpin B
MRLFLTSLLWGFVFVLSAQEKTPDLPPQKEDILSSVALRNPDQLRLVIKGNNHLAFDLYQQLKSKKGNIFFSPFSVANGLAMVGLGARGETADEIAKVLNYSLSIGPLNGDLNVIFVNLNPKRDVNQLLIASNLWLQPGIPVTVAYQNQLKQNFNQALVPLDFKESLNAVRKINQWVSDQTKGKITQQVNASDFSNETRMLITTALYIKGNWVNPFDIRKTKRASFKTDDKYSSQVDMMQTTALFSYRGSEQLTIVELPYLYEQEKGAALSVYVLLPASINGIEQLEKDFNDENWSKWIKEMRPHPLNLSLPRYRDDGRFELNQTLNTLGMEKAFTPNADFSGISLDKGLFINKIIHKTSIRIDERGTDAFTTAIPVALDAAAGEKPIDVAVDHPFLYVIVDQKTGSIISIGRMMRP